MIKFTFFSLFLILSTPLYSASLSFDVLRVGNSYTARASGYFNNFIEAARTKLDANITITSRTGAGLKLYTHARSENVKNDIASGNYEHIVLQEQSVQNAYAYSFFNTKKGKNFFREYEEASSIFGPRRAQEYSNTSTHSVYRAYKDNDADDTLGFYDQIQANSASSQVHIYQTWGRRQDKAEDLSLLTGGSRDSHTARNVIMADQIAAEGRLYGLEVSIARVGEAWQSVIDENGDTILPGFNFNTYHSDGSHPSRVGQFFSEAVIMQSILDVEAPGLKVSELGYTGGPRIGNNTAMALLSVADTFSTIESIPEPSSLSLLGFGLFGFIIRRKR